MSAALKSMIVGLVSGILPTDDLGQKHRQNALTWLAGTDDIFRRVKPLTPSPHLVSYFLLVDRPAGSVLLCDHRLSGLWLPAGGHVEPGEHPLDTVRREAVEELGVIARPDAASQDRPFFLTMTETVGPLATRHVDVSLWFALAGHVGQPLRPDQREFVQVRWWTVAELREAALGRFEPHLPRAMDALGLGRRNPNSPRYPEDPSIQA
jgi:8-oxo-dGTP diphosphatase